VVGAARKLRRRYTPETTVQKVRTILMLQSKQLSHVCESKFKKCGSGCTKRHPLAQNHVTFCERRVPPCPEYYLL
jgi:hypothetical protein